MKEIDQRNKKNLHIRCNCGSDHFLEFDYFTDEDIWEGEIAEKMKKPKKDQWKHYYIGFVDTGDWNFWERLKICFKYLFKNDAYICYRSIGITSKDMDKITKHFNEYKQT
ncbi:MAG: hypothetical protein KJI69_06180 [Patescibacteria group bacterium]|nr:hypothetical protein [Patescibacteria group bacterium]